MADCFVSSEPINGGWRPSFAVSLDYPGVFLPGSGSVLWLGPVASLHSLDAQQELHPNWCGAAKAVSEYPKSAAVLCVVADLVSASQITV